MTVRRQSSHASPSRPLSTLRRQAKTILPPDVVDGGPVTRPILVRTAKIRYAAGYGYYQTGDIRQPRRKSKRPEGPWKALVISLPREIVEVAGLDVGMTMCMEAYADGRVRMFPGGDALSREEENV